MGSAGGMPQLTIHLFGLGLALPAGLCIEHDQDRFQQRHGHLARFLDGQCERQGQPAHSRTHGKAPTRPTCQATGPVPLCGLLLARAALVGKRNNKRAVQRAACAGWRAKPSANKRTKARARYQPITRRVGFAQAASKTPTMQARARAITQHETHTREKLDQTHGSNSRHRARAAQAAASLTSGRLRGEQEDQAAKSTPGAPRRTKTPRRSTRRTGSPPLSGRCPWALPASGPSRH